MLDDIGSWAPIVIATLSSVVVAGIGGWLTRIGPWYRGLRKPSWQPPDWLFGPAWTVIFIFITASGVFAWQGGTERNLQATVLVLFGINAALNIAWSALFFRIERPDWALAEVIVLWLSILALIVGLWPISTTASLLLLPYLGWVSFASYLNLTIVRLNPRTNPVIAMSDARDH